MTYPIYIFFGLVPSVIWLLFYLRKDVHPESNRMILKIFFYGMLIAIIAALIELVFSTGLVAAINGNLLKAFPILFFVIYNFIIIALVEESSKYLIVKARVLNDSEFDEPVDIMLYMIIVALGFAALENVLVLFAGKEPLLFYETFRNTVIISFCRFIGATFLHALCSGTLGYFLALSLFETKKRLRLVILGLVVATILHGSFNISIIRIEESLISQNFQVFIFSFISLTAILTGLAFFVSFGFRKLKKIKSICKTSV